MAKEAFGTRRFQAKTLEMIQVVGEVLEAAMAEGYTFTLRQLHYHFVQSKYKFKFAKPYLNTKQDYERLGYIVDEGRKAGLVDWSAIEDRNRNLNAIKFYTDPEAFMRSVINWYAEPLWADQDYYCEVWVEKDALIGVIERPCNKFRVPYIACRGYMSTSEQYDAGKRFAEQRRRGKKCVLFYLGDHDPSGIDMTRNNDELVNWYARSGAVEVRRLGLNMDQIEELDLAPDYAKEKDSRLAGYMDRFETDESWELDALSPKFIDALVTEAITGLLDMDKFKAAQKRERANDGVLHGVMESWEDVGRYLKYQHVDIEVQREPSHEIGELYTPVNATAYDLVNWAESEVLTFPEKYPEFAETEPEDDEGEDDGEPDADTDA